MHRFHLIGAAMIAVLVAACSGGGTTLPGSPGTISVASTQRVVESPATAAAPAPTLNPLSNDRERDLSVSATSLTFTSLHSKRTFQVSEDNDSRSDRDFSARARVPTPMSAW